MRHMGCIRIGWGTCGWWVGPRMLGAQSCASSNLMMQSSPASLPSSTPTGLPTLLYRRYLGATRSYPVFPFAFVRPILLHCVFLARLFVCR